MNEQEEIILVSKDDVVTGYKLKRDITDEDCFRFALVWIEDGQGKALIHKRTDTKKHYPGRWQNAAGGFVQRGESYEQAARRELYEELGIENFELEHISKEFIANDGPGRIADFYRIIHPFDLEKLTPNTREVAALEWRDKKQLFRDIKAHPDNYMPSSAYWDKLFS